MPVANGFYYVQYMVCPKEGSHQGVKSALVNRSSKELAIVAIRLAFGRSGVDVVVLMCEVATDKQLTARYITKLI